MCRSVKDIMENDPIIAEIQAHIDQNNLAPLDKLQLRVQKHNYARVIQIKEDLKILDSKIQKHIDSDDCHTPKGILLRGKVIAWAVFIMILVSTIVAYLPEKVAILLTP